MSEKYLVIYYDQSFSSGDGEPNYCQETGYGPKYEEHSSKLQAYASAERKWRVTAILTFQDGDGLEEMKNLLKQGE